MKCFRRIVVLILALTLTLGQVSAVAAVESVSTGPAADVASEIDALIASGEPKNHIAALKILQNYGMAKEQVVYNEYEAYLADKAILEDSPAQVSALDANVIESVVNFEENFAERIERLNTYSDAQLRSVNYTDDQIYAIRNFDGSAEMMSRAASTCTVYGGFTNWSASSSGTTVQNIAAFQWNGEYPYTSLLGYKDIFATTWTEPFQSELSDEEGYVTYAYSEDNTQYTDSFSTTAKGIFDSEIVFQNYKSRYYNGTRVNYLVTAGSIICYLASADRETMASAFASYGKNTSAITPSLDVTPDGVALSLAYSEKVEPIASNRWHYR